MKRVASFVTSWLVLIVAFSATALPAIAQNPILYHFHKEYISPYGMPTLQTANPVAPSTYSESYNLKSYSTVPQTVNWFEAFRSTAAGTWGTLPANSTVTFNVWMSKTANYGTVYPRFHLWVYQNN